MWDYYGNNLPLGAGYDIGAHERNAYAARDGDGIPDDFEEENGMNAMAMTSTGIQEMETASRTCWNMPSVSVRRLVTTSLWNLTSRLVRYLGAEFP